MQRAILSDAVALLLSEETFGSGQEMLHQWFVEQNRAIYESLMQDDEEGEDGIDSLTNSIKDDKAEIESEEFYGESDESDTNQDDVLPLQGGNSELQTDMEKLKIIFNQIIGGQSDLGVDLNGDGNIDSDIDGTENDSEEFEDHATLSNNEEEV